MKNLHIESLSVTSMNQDEMVFTGGGYSVIEFWADVKTSFFEFTKLSLDILKQAPELFKAFASAVKEYRTIGN